MVVKESTKQRAESLYLIGFYIFVNFSYPQSYPKFIKCINFFVYFYML